MIISNIHNLNFKEGGHGTQKIHCPKCHDERRNKQDKSLSVDIEKRVFKCHHCGWSGRIDGWKEEKEYKAPDKTGWSNFKDETAVFLAGRGFSLSTIQKNKIIEKKWFCGPDRGNVTFVGYPYFEIGKKEPVNVKWRGIEKKEFRQEKDAKPVMYNLPFWHESKEVIILEGENDVLAFNEAGIWEATTLPGGAINENDKNVDGKLAGFHNCYQYFENKEVVYLATDSDAPGRRLRDELIKRIGAEKCRVITFPSDCKDANECLQKYGKEKLLECKASAKEVPVSGIFYLSDVMESMIDGFVNGIGMGELTHFGNFDTIFRWKKGQINLWTGYANFGKSTFVLQVCLLKSIMDGWKWVVFSPENYPAIDFYNDIVEMYVGKNVDDQYGNKMSLEEYQEACDFINAHFFFIYPDDAHTIETLHDLCKILLLKHGIDGLIIDPYNQVDNSEDDTMYKEIQKFMSKVKRFTVEHNISYNIIAHPKSPNLPKDGGEFKAADTYDIAGGSMWANKADNIISYHRPNWFVDKSDSLVTVHTQKIKRKRTGGKLDSITLNYDFKTARFYETDALMGKKYLCDPKRKRDYESIQEFDTSFDFGDDQAPF